MKNMAKSLSILFAILFCSIVFTRPALAEWTVNNQRSEFYFVTTKAGAPGTNAVQEVQTFKTVNGKVDDKGNIEVSIDLASVETGISIRDQRIRELLFNVLANPKALFTGKTDITAIQAFSPGMSKNLDIDGKIVLAGKTQAISVKLRVTKLADNYLLVETRLPFIINVSDFGLQSGVEALRNIMGLNVLSSAAPVSFSILFN